MAILTSGERARITLIFCLMGGAILALLVRLTWLQLGRHSTSHELSIGYRTRSEELPAQRSRIVDRQGELLAYDRPVYQAWGEIYLPVDPTTGALDESRRAVDRLVSDLMVALCNDRSLVPDLAAERELRRRLEQRIRAKAAPRCNALAERILAARVGKRTFAPERVKIDCPLHHEIVDALAILGLRELDVRRRETARGETPPPYVMYVTLRRRYERVYSEPELMAGVVGRVRDHHGTGGVEQRGVEGLERLEIAAPRTAGAREYIVDARESAFWTASGRQPEAPLSLGTTLDTELQRAAVRCLDVAIDRVVERYGSPPDWGAIMAVDVRSGSVLAMQSFVQKAGVQHVEREEFGLFAPTEAVFEPGSVVKPLVFAFGLEQGRIDWSRTWDCRALRLPREGASKFRTITDSHDCELLRPREILINSSNIGAVQVGMELGPDGIQRYLEGCRFHEPFDLPLPRPRHRVYPKGDLADLPWNEREIYTVPSLVFGYGMQTTVAHVARAYLTLLNGRPGTLRLVDWIEADGERRRVALPAAGPRLLSERSILMVKDALVGMIDGEAGATALHVTKLLRERGVPPGLVGGKSGTSEALIRDPKTRREDMVRTASFVGFAPASDPRVLTICVVQKKNAASFYGGTYAGPAAGMLLLEAIERESQRSESGASVRTRAADVAWGRQAPKQKGR